MFEAGPQAKLEHGAKAEHVRLAYVGIGLDEAHVGSQVIDRVDPLAEPVEHRLAQSEMLLEDVAGHHAQARRPLLLPDFGPLQGIAQAREPVFGALGADQAVHDQPVVLPQELAQEEAPYETGCPGQQDLSKVCWRHGLGGRLSGDRRVNDAGAARPRPYGIAAAGGQ